MLSILTGVVSLLPSAFGTINKVTDAIANERLKQIQAKTDQEKVASEERVKTLEAQRDALVAESNRSKMPIFIQSFVGLSVSFLVAKLLVWDKALGQWTNGHTDALGDNLTWVLSATIGFYFLSSTASILKK